MVALEHAAILRLEGLAGFHKLIYMSIDALILDRVARGMLHPLIPRSPGATARRALFLHEDLYNLLRSTNGDPETQIRLALLEADLGVFVESPTIDPKYLFLLYPARDAVWEIRSVRDDPSIRVLGLFAKKDVFVATNYALRKDLGGWQSREWKNVKRLARARWNNLFHQYNPHPSKRAKTLVTGAVDGKYFKNPPSRA